MHPRGVCFHGSSGRVVSGEQRFDLRAEIGIIPADAIEVSGPRGWIGPFQGFGDDGHHLRVIRGHQFVS